MLPEPGTDAVVIFCAKVSVTATDRTALEREHGSERKQKDFDGAIHKNIVPEVIERE